MLLLYNAMPCCSFMLSIHITYVNFFSTYTLFKVCAFCGYFNLLIFAFFLLIVDVDFSITGATFLKPSDFNTFVQCYDPSDFMFCFVTGGFDTLDRSCWIILNTFQKLEHETIDYLVNKKKLKTILLMSPILPPPYFGMKTKLVSHG